MPERPWLDLVFVFGPRVFVFSHRVATQAQSGVYDAFRASRLYLWQSCMKQRNWKLVPQFSRNRQVSPSSVFSLSVFQQGCCRDHPNTGLWGAPIAELERRTKQCHYIDGRITIRPLALLQTRRKLKLLLASKGPGSKTFNPETWIDHRIFMINLIGHTWHVGETIFVFVGFIWFFAFCLTRQWRSWTPNSRSWHLLHFWATKHGSSDSMHCWFRLTSEIAPESMQLTVFCPTPLPKLRMTNTGKTARYVW